MTEALNKSLKEKKEKLLAKSKLPAPSNNSTTIKESPSNYPE